MTTASNDLTGTIHDHIRVMSDVLAELGSAHLQAAAIAAELDLDHAQLWEQADGIVVRLSTEAYHMTAVATGEPATNTAALAPPIVRLRELAVAQSRLFALLNRATGPGRSAGKLLTDAHRSARRVRTLGRQLQWLLR
ncbi:MAG TPA: hypothetical protein VFR23_20800 [Jiangellaceae bacterium]|nr:hypothetical protein [Jiangellaceae bacterium]